MNYELAEIMNYELAERRISWTNHERTCWIKGKNI